MLTLMKFEKNRNIPDKIGEIKKNPLAILSFAIRSSAMFRSPADDNIGSEHTKTMRILTEKKIDSNNPLIFDDLFTPKVLPLKLFFGRILIHRVINISHMTLNIFQDLSVCRDDISLQSDDPRHKSHH